MNLKPLLKKYRRGIFATLTMLIGGSPQLQSVYDHISSVLASVGIDWGTVLSLAGGAISWKAVLPYVAVVAAVYIIKPGAVDVEALREEMIKVLKEKPE